MNKDLKYYMGLNYKTVLEYEPSDKSWIAYCPELGRGTCYAIGENQQEALNFLEDTKKEILQYALDEGKKISEPKFGQEELPSGHFIVRLPKSLHKKLKDNAEKESVSLNQYVVSILSENVGKKVALASLDQVFGTIVKIFSENANIWKSSVFTIKSPLLKVSEKENFNKWIVEYINVEETKPQIGWRTFSKTV